MVMHCDTSTQRTPAHSPRCVCCVFHARVKSHAEFLVSQFAQVGISGDIRNPLMKESQSQYKLFCSGRRHCVGMMCDLQLAKRHDLISVLMGLVQPSEDVLVSLATSSPNTCMHPHYTLHTQHAHNGLFRSDDFEFFCFFLTPLV